MLEVPGAYLQKDVFRVDTNIMSLSFSFVFGCNVKIGNTYVPFQAQQRVIEFIGQVVR